MPTGDDVAAFERELCAGGGADARRLDHRPSPGSPREVAAALALELGPRLSRRPAPGAGPRRDPPRRAARGCAARRRAPGFAPALDALIAELQAALIDPGRVRAAASPSSTTRPTSASSRRSTPPTRSFATRGGRSDDGVVAAAAIAALRADPDAWGGGRCSSTASTTSRRDQIELVAALAPRRARSRSRSPTPTAARSRRARACSTALSDELGAERPEPLPFDPELHDERRPCATSTATCSSPSAGAVEPDDGLVLLSPPARAARPRRSGSRSPACSPTAYEPDEIAIVVRHPDSSGPLLASVLRDARDPGGARGLGRRSPRPCVGTVAGRALPRGGRRGARSRRCSPTCAATRRSPPGAVDWRRAADPPRRRHDGRRARPRAGRSRRATSRACARPTDAAARLRALARSARELAEGAHREQAPLAGSSPPTRRDAVLGASSCAPASRRRSCSRSSRRSATLPGCRGSPGSPTRSRRSRSATVPLWRGPADGPGPDPEPLPGARGAGAGLFCAALQDGEFPSAAPPDPLLSEERRRAARQPRPAPRRPGRRGALPLPRLRLAPDRAPLPELAELRRGRRGAGALAVRRRGPRPARRRPASGRAAAAARPRARARGARAGEASTAARARPGARARRAGDADRAATLERLGVGAEPAARTLALFERLPDPERPPRAARVAGGARGRSRRARCSAPTRSRAGSPARTSGSSTTSSRRSALEPERRPAVARRRRPRRARAPLREPPGDDSIPRPATSAAGSDRFGELLDESRGQRPGAALNRRAARCARARPDPGRGLPRRRGRRARREFRPARTCSSSASGARPRARGRRADPRPALELGDFELRGRIDRIDLAADGRSAIVRDYKTGKNVASADKFGERGHAADPALHAGRPARARARPGRRPLPAARRDRPERPPAARGRRRRRRAPRRASTSSARDRKPRRGARGAARRAPRRSRSRRRPRMRAGRDRPRPAQRRVPEVLHLPADLPPRARARRRRRGERERR